MSPLLPRGLHPAAWWGWAVGLAIAVSTVNEPAPAAHSPWGSRALVVTSRRGSSPWAQVVPALSLARCCSSSSCASVLHVLVGLKFGERVVLPLPEVTLPSWAAGIDILGGRAASRDSSAPSRLGLRLAVIIACIGAANALANPKRLLRSLPGALQRDRVRGRRLHRRSRHSWPRASSACCGPAPLRGDTTRGIRAVPRSPSPSSRTPSTAPSCSPPRWTPAATGVVARSRPCCATLTGACHPRRRSWPARSASTACSTRPRPDWLGAPVLLAAVALSLTGSGSAAARTRAQHLPPRPLAGAGVAHPRLQGWPPPWRCSSSSRTDGSSPWRCRSSPLPFPPCRSSAVAGLLVAGLPAYLTPAPPAPATRGETASAPLGHVERAEGPAPCPDGARSRRVGWRRDRARPGVGDLRRCQPTGAA